MSFGESSFLIFLSVFEKNVVTAALPSRRFVAEMIEHLLREADCLGMRLFRFADGHRFWLFFFGGLRRGVIFVPRIKFGLLDILTGGVSTLPATPFHAAANPAPFFQVH